MNMYVYIVGRRKAKINATELHINTYEGFQVGPTRLLENGGETYEKWIDTLATIIVHNMQSALQDCYNSTEWPFHHVLNIDRGTQTNPDNIRNCIVYMVKTKLDLSQNAVQWRNEKTGHIYDFRDYYVIVSQELFHLFIRLRNAKLWHYHHSDCWIVSGAFSSITTGMQRKFDMKESPNVLSATQKHPYQIFAECPFLQNENVFSTLCVVIQAFSKLRGTFEKKLRSELLKTIHNAKIVDSRVDNQKAIYIISRIIASLLLNCTPRHYGRIESVTTFSSYIYLCTYIYIYHKHFWIKQKKKLFYIGKDRWLKYKIKDLFFVNEESKRNNDNPIEIDIPFYTTNNTIHEDFLLLANRTGTIFKTKDYRFQCGPFASCLQSQAEFESNFQLGLV